MFQNHGDRFYGEMDIDGANGIGEEGQEDFEEWSESAEIIVNGPEKHKIPHWMFDVITIYMYNRAISL